MNENGKLSIERNNSTYVRSNVAPDDNTTSYLAMHDDITAI